jgi:iron complex outermembrane receptor protein
VEFGVHEKVSSVYVQADFAGDRWSANAGVRFARTQDTVAVNTGVPASAAASTPGVITTSAFGDYVVNSIPNNYNDVLPSVNFKYNLAQNLIGRFDVSETMTRPDYSSLAGAITATVLPTAPNSCCGSASGGNPNLKPTKSTNVDAGVEWYFAPKSLLAAEVYYMSLKDYISFNTFQTTIFTQNQAFPQGFQGLYTVTAPQNANARVQGVELSYTQSFFQYWGVEANYTYADGKQTSNIPPPAPAATANIAAAAGDQMVGTSKSTANAILFFEDRGFSARVAYTYRSSFFSGLDRASAFFQNGVGSLAASIDYQITDALEVSLDGLNLNNPEYKYFASASQPRSFYRNGSQYYLNLRFQF